MRLVYTFRICIIAALVLTLKAQTVLSPTKACMKECKVSDQEQKKYYQNGMKDADATDGIKCLGKCIMEKRGFFKNGKFDEQKFIKDISTVPAMKSNLALFTKVADICKDIEGENEIDTAYKISMCFKDNKAPLGGPTSR